MSMENQQNWVYSEITEGIKVSVIPEFYPEGSNREQSVFVWLYNVKIENLGTNGFQIIGRHWQIFDAHGKMDEIEGAGVVGYQPIIRSGETFEYTSQVRLFTHSGLMRGEYYGRNLDSGQQIVVTIPAFSLDTAIEPIN